MTREPTISGLDCAVNLHCQPQFKPAAEPGVPPDKRLEEPVQVVQQHGGRAKALAENPQSLQSGGCSAIAATSVQTPLEATRMKRRKRRLMFFGTGTCR